jgi:hypothetical protein
VTWPNTYRGDERVFFQLMWKKHLNKKAYRNIQLMVVTTIGYCSVLGVSVLNNNQL